MMSRQQLASLVERGLTIRAMASELAVSPTTVRRRLRKYGLETRRIRRLRATASARATGARRTVADCPRHGRGTFTRSPTGGFRCLQCRNDAVSRRRRMVKDILVTEAGGACKLCGYNRCSAALQFHHEEPILKAFSISERGVTRALAKAREEARKCVLLCANCMPRWRQE
jgi:AraC-like DNA-binding protein